MPQLNFFSLKVSVRDVTQTSTTRCYRLRYLTQGQGGLPYTEKPCLVLFLEICLSFLIRKTPGEHQEVKYLFAEKKPGLPDVLSQRAGESLPKAARITSCRVHKWLPTVADRASFLKRHTFPLTTTSRDSAWHRAGLLFLERSALVTAISECL